MGNNVFRLFRASPHSRARLKWFRCRKVRPFCLNPCCRSVIDANFFRHVAPPLLCQNFGGGVEGIGDFWYNIGINENEIREYD